MFKEKIFRKQFTILVLTFFSLKFLQSTPYEALFFKVHAVFLGLGALYYLFYVASFSIRHNHINNVVRYFLILIAIVPFYSAYRAHVEFGQPYMYGVLSERNIIAIGVAIWFYRTLVTKRIELANFESTFVFMAWASLVFFCFIILTYEPSQSNSDSNFVRMTADRGLRFKFQNYFITFGAIYYLAKHAVYKRVKYLLSSLIFLSYIIFIVQGRTYIITIGITLLLFSWFHYQGKRMVSAVNLTIFLVLAVLLIQAVRPEYFERMGYLFVQMLTALMNTQSQDMSANARIHETKIVLDYFNLHPLSLLLGTGKISSQWRNGYESFLGYFYPSDIGVLGGIFMYGITGLIFLCLVPFIVSIRTLQRVASGGEAFIIALKYLLFFGLVGTIQGSFFFMTMDYVIPLFILLAYKNLNGDQVDARK